MFMKTIVRRIWLAAGVSALALASFAGAAGAETANALPSPEKTFTGTVTAVDPTEHILKARGTLLLTKKFNLGTDCSYKFLDNKFAGYTSGAEAALHPGQKIIVGYREADGVLVADRVEQQPMNFAGWVKTVNPVTHTVTVQPAGFGFSKQFQYADGCQVTLRGARSGKFADIQAGNYVTLTYETPPGLPTVQRIAQTSEQFTGSLTAIDLDEKTLKAKTTLETKSFNVGDHCVVVINGKGGGHLSDLRPDEKLIFTYDEINGINVVNRIVPVGDSGDVVNTAAPASSY